MPTIAWILVGLTIGGAAPQDPGAYVRQDERVEQHFREYRQKLDDFHDRLHKAVEEEAPDLLPRLRESPPEPVLYGYGLLPELVEDPPPPVRQSGFAFRTYNWVLTGGYIDGEEEKLRRTNADFLRLQEISDQTAKGQVIEQLVNGYRELVSSQKAIDQHVQYNRFWQRAIAADRARFDQLTQIYNLMKAQDAEINSVVRQALGTPNVPSFLKVVERDADHIVIRVPVYTDIENDAFLARARTAIEQSWQVKDGSTDYRAEVEFRYLSINPPKPGEHFDLRAYAAQFPMDGALLTTGAESTHAFVGRYIALGTGALSFKTLAHEFGHILGFRDGYVRGYRDLGDDGFEIMELTSAFDDIMSAPGEGLVQPSHFKLILDNLP